MIECQLLCCINIKCSNDNVFAHLNALSFSALAADTSDFYLEGYC